MTSSDGNIFRGTCPLWGESTGDPPVARNFGVFFDLHWTNGYVNNRDADDLRCHCAHCDVTLMSFTGFVLFIFTHSPQGCFIGIGAVMRSTLISIWIWFWVLHLSYALKCDRALKRLLVENLGFPIMQRQCFMGFRSPSNDKICLSYISV